MNRKLTIFAAMNRGKHLHEMDLVSDDSLKVTANELAELEHNAVLHRHPDDWILQSYIEHAEGGGGMSAVYCVTTDRKKSDAFCDRMVSLHEQGKLSIKAVGKYGDHRNEGHGHVVLMVVATSELKANLSTIKAA